MGAEAKAVLRQSDGFVTHSTHLPLLVVLLLLYVISCNLANIITPLYVPILLSLSLSRHFRKAKISPRHARA